MVPKYDRPAAPIGESWPTGASATANGIQAADLVTQLVIEPPRELPPERLETAPLVGEIGGRRSRPTTLTGTGATEEPEEERGPDQRRQHPERHFGRRSLGMWLGECGYVPGADELLRETAVRYFDPSPRLWLTSLGLSLIIGIALILNAGSAADVRPRMGGWQRLRQREAGGERETEPDDRAHQRREQHGPDHHRRRREQEAEDRDGRAHRAGLVTSYMTPERFSPPSSAAGVGGAVN